MRMALNLAKMAKEGFSSTAREETKYLLPISRAKVREVKQQGVEFPGHIMVKTAIQRHMVMLCQNHISSCLPCQNGTTQNSQTPCRHKATAVRLTNQCTQRTPEPTPPLPGTPLGSTDTTCRAQSFQIVNLPAEYTYKNTATLCSEYFNHDPSAQDSQYDTDVDPDILTDERKYTGLCTMCCVVLKLTSILKNGAAC
jgi:hypothetical protein